MREEFSAGGVVYKNENGEVWWLIGKHSGYHKWVLPKGMIEVGETKEQTALREVREETGIEARIVSTNPLQEETYFYTAEFKSKSSEGQEVVRRVKTYQEEGGVGERVKKTVTFYLMEYVQGWVGDKSFEMEEVEWVDYEHALKLLAFTGERAALEKAQKLVVQNKGER